MKKGNLIGLVIIGLAITAIISTFGDASSYETFASAQEYPDKEYHIVGQLTLPEKMHYDPAGDANLFSFYLKDKADEVKKVIFYGAKPHDFERSEQIVLTGKPKGEDFIATKILMKCPSKYTNTEVTAAALNEEK